MISLSLKKNLCESIHQILNLILKAEALDADCVFPNRVNLLLFELKFCFVAFNGTSHIVYGIIGRDTSTQALAVATLVVHSVEVLRNDFPSCDCSCQFG